MFNNRKYRSGHFASNKNGDLIIEFSEDDANDNDDYRLFYGLKSDGRYYFKNEQPTYEFQITGAKNDDASSTYYGRYESNNLFVSLNNNEDNEYLFSVSSFNELLDVYNEVRMPINYYQNKKHTQAIFMIINDVMCWEYILDKEEIENND